MTRDNGPQDTEYACPRCGDPLTPIVMIEGGCRRVIGLSCREAYCDHFQGLHEPLRNRARVLRDLEHGANGKRSA
jgi:hypothetical protein